MAFDQITRNRLQKFVTEARALLSEEFTRQLQHTYGMNPDNGQVADLTSLAALSPTEQETARLLRDTFNHYLANGPKGKEQDRQIAALDRIVREQAFTVLNRLAALRMSEARQFLTESVAKGYQSKGFVLYQRMAGSALGEVGDAYQQYLFSLFDEFSQDLSVLFDRFAVQGRLFPRPPVLQELLKLINQVEIAGLWGEDETNGWIYQYFNSVDERRQMRAESAAPRNSRELAVRNQFFTPRYVVEFLTDNTLGRIWYEMIQGKTSLKDSCQYLVRRPSEVFLEPGQPAPEHEDCSGLSQEELLQQPAYIEHRPLKDPRDIKMLDPACGSMHFGLYAFDLFERIYEEAWDLEVERGSEALIRDGEKPPLIENYQDKAAFLADIPRLIIENNIHGVDIDPRAAQIAGLSLWLRAHNAWQKLAIKPNMRPRIRRSHVVCAEPMPGEKELLKEFSEQLKPRVLGQLIEGIFEKMELAGEAGSLLQIEKEIKDALAEAKGQWHQKKQALDLFPDLLNAAKKQSSLQFDVKEIDDASFWDQAEQLILNKLADYAENATEKEISQRRLFAEDASKGFSFIDLCRKRFDVVLMNPPFGACSQKSKSLLKSAYPNDWTDLYSCFIARSIDLLARNGSVGAITSNLWLSIKRQGSIRNLISGPASLRLVADLGGGVLDTATVDTALAVIDNTRSLPGHLVGFYIGRDVDNRELLLRSCKPEHVRLAAFSKIPSNPFCLDLGAERINLWSRVSQRLDPDLSLTFKGNGTFDNFRFLRTYWEIPSLGIGSEWIRYDKGGFFQPFFNPSILVWKYKNHASENRAFQIGMSGTDAQVAQSSKHWGKPGLCYSRATSIGFSPRILASGHVVNDKSIAILPKNTEEEIGILALLASTHIQDLLYAFGYHRNIEKGAVASLPLGPNIVTKALVEYGELALKAMDKLESTVETSPVFLRPAHRNERLQYIEQVESSIRQIDTEVATSLYGNEKPIILSKPKEQLIKKALKERFGSSKEDFNRAWRSYAVGVIYRRWCLDLSNEPLKSTISSNPSGELPQIQPGREALNSGYPLNGVTAIDKGHKLDLPSLCEKILSSLSIDTDGLREWHLGEFFDEHLATYSQSGRSAPIYWPLQTTSGSYTLWLYYHQISEQTIYTSVNDFVEPKIDRVVEELGSLRSTPGRSRQEEKEVERLTELEAELKNFRDELLHIAKFWKPNLSDGVQINAAPLWKLFKHRGWQKKLRETWEKLENGDYDWAHLACTIWPGRVLRKCHQDRSLAIAHSVDNDLWHEVEVTKGRKTVWGWQPKPLTQSHLNNFIQQKIAERG